MAKAPSDRHHPSSPLHWQETYPGVQQGHRILILGSFLESPVQTSPGTWRSHAHQPNDLTGNDDVTDCHDRNHRHVGGPPSVGQHDADRPSAGDLSGEDDDPSGDGPHRLPRRCRELHPTATGQPRLGRRIEPLDDATGHGRTPPGRHAKVTRRSGSPRQSFRGRRRNAARRGRKNQQARPDDDDQHTDTDRSPHIFSCRPSPRNPPSFSVLWTTT